MTRGKRCPGSVNNGAKVRAKDRSSTKSVLGPGVNLEESKDGKCFEVAEGPDVSSLGRLQRSKKEVRLTPEQTRAILVISVFSLFALFIIFSIVSLTWVILADKPATELGTFLQIAVIPLTALVGQILKPYLRSPDKRSGKSRIGRG